MPIGNDLLASVAKRKVARSARVASWDQKGLNEDAFVVLPGESIVLAKNRDLRYFLYGPYI